MTQGDVLEILASDPKKAFTVQELRDRLQGAKGSITTSLRKLYKYHEVYRLELSRDPRTGVQIIGWQHKEVNDG